MDDKKIMRRLPLFYLALGSISLYLCINFIGSIASYLISESELYTHGLATENSFDTTGYWIGFIITLIASILLILSYYGFTHQRKYPRFTGIVGCMMLIMTFFHCVYYSITVYEEYFGLVAPILLTSRLGQVSLSAASVILLVLTMIYWKKLV